jgi:hypothetical protein
MADEQVCLNNNNNNNNLCIRVFSSEHCFSFSGPLITRFQLHSWRNAVNKKLRKTSRKAVVIYTIYPRTISWSG